MASQTKTNIKKIAPSENYGGSSDPIRQDLKNYYIGGVAAAGGTSEFRLLNAFNEVTVRESLIGTSGVIYNISSNQLSDDFTTYTTEMTITSSDEFFDNLSSSMEGQTYEDSYVVCRAPIEYASSVDNKSSIQGDVEFVYNYGSSSYEFVTSEAQEEQIPNYYQIPIRRIKKKKFEPLVGQESVIDYIISNSEYYKAAAKQEYRSNLPFYAMISFTSPKLTEAKKDKYRLSEIIIDGTEGEPGLSALFCDILNLIQSGFFGGIEEYISKKSGTGTSLTSEYKEGTNQTEFREVYATFSQIIEKYDLSYMMDLVETLLGTLDTGSNLTTTIENIRKVFKPEREMVTLAERKKRKRMREVLPDEELDTTDLLATTDASSAGVRGINAIDDLRQKLDEIMKKESRGFEDILMGKKPYSSDILFYSIDKYEFGSSIPIQTFWIPSVFIYLGLDYIDTQVKYGKRYTYEVSAYKITLDTELEYTLEEKVEVEIGDPISGEGDDIIDPTEKKGTLPEGDIEEPTRKTERTENEDGDEQTREEDQEAGNASSSSNRDSSITISTD